MTEIGASEDLSKPRLILWRGDASQAFSSREFDLPAFDRAVISWNCSGISADARASFELEVDSVRYAMGTWSATPASAKTGDVAVDTLVLKKAATRIRFHIKPENGVRVSLVAITTWMHSDSGDFSATPSTSAWGKTLAVPERSQNIEAKDPGSICSPTSLAMVLEFHGIQKSTREVADGVFDHAEKIYGNWPFNTAYAHAVSGFETYVISAGGFAELEAEIAAGRPVVAGLRWKRGDLSNASIAETAGHLVAVVGFSDTGDVVVNDPAADPGSVRRIYKRREFFKAWMENAHGILYLVKPK